MEHVVLWMFVGYILIKKILIKYIYMEDVTYFIGVVFIYLAVFGADYYIIKTFKPKGITYILYYTILFILGIYFVFNR